MRSCGMSSPDVPPVLFRPLALLDERPQSPIDNTAVIDVFIETARPLSGFRAAPEEPPRHSSLV